MCVSSLRSLHRIQFPTSSTQTQMYSLPQPPRVYKYDCFRPPAIISLSVRWLPQQKALGLKILVTKRRSKKDFVNDDTDKLWKRIVFQKLIKIDLKRY